MYLRNRWQQFAYVYLLGAVVFFALAGWKIYLHFAFLSTVSKRKFVAPTMYSEHASMAIAFACLGAIMALAFLRTPRGLSSSAHKAIEQRLRDATPPRS